jgi:hypothetical protein
MLSAAELGPATEDERHEPAVISHAGSDGTASQTRPRRLWPVMLLRVCSAACAAFLLVWIIFLGATLPAQAVAHEWKLARIGLDVAEAIGLLFVTWAARRLREMLIPSAIVTGTLLVFDVWFDVILSWGTSDWRWSVFSAAAVELPLAALLFAAACHMIRTTVGDLSARICLAGPAPASANCRCWGCPPQCPNRCGRSLSPCRTASRAGVSRRPPIPARTVRSAARIRKAATDPAALPRRAIRGHTAKKACSNCSP